MIDIDKLLIVDALLQHEEIIKSLLDLQPYDQLVIASYLVGQLSAQMPVAAIAFVEGSQFFRERTEELIKDYINAHGEDKEFPEDEPELIQFMPSSFKETCNRDVDVSVNDNVSERETLN